jgi:pimeloyl-ACP methyl ester carboxylesterase
MPEVQAGDLQVHYIERGKGEPIVLVHGNWSTSSWWEPVLERLPEGYRGIAYDMRGRGGTIGPDNRYTMPELATDLRDFVDALGLDSFHLVGLSLGSAVAMQFVLESPERVKSLTVVSPAWVDGMPRAYNIPASQRALKANKTLYASALKSMAPTAPEDEFWQRLVDEGHKQTLKASMRNLPALRKWKPGDRLRETGVRAVVINGALDPLTGGANAQRAAQVLGARHVVMEGIGHAPVVEAPDKFVALLMENVQGA